MGEYGEDKRLDYGNSTCFFKQEIPADMGERKSFSLNNIYDKDLLSGL